MTEEPSSLIPPGLQNGEPLRLGSLEHARAFYQDLAPFRIEPLDRRRFGWALHATALGPIALLQCRHDGAVRMSGPGDPDVFVLTLPTHGSGEAGPRGRALPLAAGHAAVVVASTAISSRVDDGFGAIQLMIPRASLAHSLAAFLGSDPRRPLDLAPEIDIAAGGGAGLARLLSFAADEAERPVSVLATPLVAFDLAEAVLRQMLFGLSHSHVARLHELSRPAEPRYLRQAEEFLEANVDRPVSSVELATQVGVGVRALQLAFRRYRNSTPQRFVRERRLELARRRLVAGVGSTVTDVALATGFAHLGRFSAEYRARFGESPSETRRRRSR
jgi:AraC-like DNA-binding protein